MRRTEPKGREGGERWNVWIGAHPNMRAPRELRDFVLVHTVVRCAVSDDPGQLSHCVATSIDTQGRCQLHVDTGHAAG